MENTPNDHKEPEEDDLMAMLEESQQDFEKRLKLDEKQAEKASKEEEKSAPIVKDESKNDEKEDTSVPPVDMGEDFFKGFENFVKNIGGVGPENTNVSEEELSKASQMFKDMFKEHSEGLGGQPDSNPSIPNSDPNPAASSDNAAGENPFLSGYQNLQKDASNMSNEKGMPDLSNLNDMFQDSEFKDFFNNFTQGLFKDGEGPPEGMGEGMGEGNEMIENMLKEFSGFLNENKDDPQLKDTFDKMMKDIVSKDSMYPPMKMMKEEMPKYLEDNFDKLSQADVERYNNQLDVIEEICDKFENDPNNQEAIIELLYKLQDHGSPPEEMLKKIQSEQTMKFPGLGAMGGFPGFGSQDASN